jgi:hypothetical protein
MHTHLGRFFVLALKVIRRTVGTFIARHLAAVAYFASSGSGYGANIQGIVHLTGKEVSRTGRAERDKLLHFSFADRHRTLAVLFSSWHCEHWCFLRHYPLLRTTSCGRGVLWVVTKGMELRERSVGIP